MGAAKALAATSGLPVDGPITTFVNFASTDVAYGLVGAGFVGVATHAATGRDLGFITHHGMGVMVGGGICSAIAPVAAGLGLSAGALLRALS